MAYPYNLSRRPKVYAFDSHWDDICPHAKLSGTLDGDFRTVAGGISQSVLTAR